MVLGHKPYLFVACPQIIADFAYYKIRFCEL
jgi:hypothetical protein